MSKGIFHNVSKVSGLKTGEAVQSQSASDEQPTVADLVLPGTGYQFSDEFACLLRMLGGERDFV
jgi:hypothetical protein